ncbi:MAG TPA: hypothetical protein VIY86_12610, partial [Pirellulaceae bacterium]
LSREDIVSESRMAAKQSAEMNLSISGDESPVSAPPGPSLSRLALSASSVGSIWDQALTSLRGVTAAIARECRRVEFEEPSRLVLVFDSASHAERCDRPSAKREIQDTLASLGAGTIDLTIRTDGDVRSVTPTAPIPSQRERIFQSSQHPLVREAMELFDAEVTQVQNARKR